MTGAVTFDIESIYRVDIASTGNAMMKLLEITGGRPAPIDKIKIVYTYNSTPVQIELSRSGSVAISLDDDEHLHLHALFMRVRNFAHHACFRRPDAPWATSRAHACAPSAPRRQPMACILQATRTTARGRASRATTVV